ncbi:MAG: hypothetical protein DRR19_29340 [Candidatus Parabeggiatoa sp. nov. 1]|nr:MAG: hypothetical protein DRR19_29340 [Gammaproteobacteria bacterium]
MKKLTLTILLFFILSGCIPNPLLKTPSDLDKQHFKQTVTIDDHPSNTVVTFSTIKGVQEKQGTHNVVLNDNFLRGFFNKETNAKTYQVYNVVYYAASGSDSRWKHFEQANYQTPVGDKITPTTLIKEDEDCSAINLYGQCLYSEHVTFKVDEAWLKRVATSYAPRPPTDNIWRYMLISKSGDSHKDKLLKAEVAGLLERMTQYASLPTNLQGKAPPMKSGTAYDPSRTPEPLVKPQPAKDVLPMIKP